jgi:hypothetical protein
MRGSQRLLNIQIAKCFALSPAPLSLPGPRHLNCYDWTKVEVIGTPKSREVGYMIARRDLDSELCEHQRTENKEVGKAFERMWKNLRPNMDKIFKDDPSRMEEPCNRPKDYKEAVSMAAEDGGFLWKFGHWLYESCSGKVLTEAETKSFIEVCPPFRAVCYGLVMAAYNWPLRAHDGNRRASAGRNDLLMAAYLPYCDQFITNDGPQKENLREIASEAKISCEIRCLNEFDMRCDHLAGAGQAVAR